MKERLSSVSVVLPSPSSPRQVQPKKFGAVKTTRPKRKRAARIPATRIKAKKRRRGKRNRFSSSKPVHLHPARTSEQAQEDDLAYTRGYAEGWYGGGEKLLEERLPQDVLIPDLTVAEALAAGVQVLRARGVPLLGPEAVFQELEDALLTKTPRSLVRLGDGELLTLAQDTVMSIQQVREAGKFLSYAGVEVPDLKARDEMAAAIRVADLIGVPLSRRPTFQPLLFAVLRAHNIDPYRLRYTTSTMNYTLEDLGLMGRLMAGRRLVLIGDTAPELAQKLLERGMEVTGIVSPVQGIADTHRVVGEAVSQNFDMALVSAGVAAIPICVHLAAITGKVAIDFGHLANRIAGIERG